MEDGRDAKQKTRILYKVSIYDELDVKEALRFTFVPTGTNGKLPLGQSRQAVPEYILTVAGKGEETTFTWIAEPEKGGGQDRVGGHRGLTDIRRHAWLELLGNLVTTVQGGRKRWDGRRSSLKKMDDHEIGNYKAYGLSSPNGSGEALP